MRVNPGIIVASLVACTLSACSGTQGTGDVASTTSPPTTSAPGPLPAPGPAPAPAPASPNPYPPPLPAVPLPPVAALACSPCKRIAFTSSRDGNDEIYSVNADGSDLIRLTHNQFHDDEPSWSPDGQHIAFISDRDGILGLYVMDADGRNVVRRTSAKVWAAHPAWSPLGHVIAYSTCCDSGSLDLWTVTVSDGQENLLFAAPGWDGEPSWSPDGSRLVLSTDWLAYDFGTELFLINADGSGFRSLLDGSLFNRTYHANPCWSPNGALIAMSVYREIGFNRYDAQLGLVKVDGSGFTPLIAFAEGWSKCSWSPDGSKIAYASGKSGVQDILWVSADGSARGTIISNGRSPDWQR